MYGYRNGSVKQHTGRQMVQPNNMQFKARKYHQKIHQISPDNPDT